MFETKKCEDLVGQQWQVHENNHRSVELVQEISRRATLIPGKPREFIFMFQQLSIALQSENAVAFLNTFDSDYTPLQSYLA